MSHELQATHWIVPEDSVSWNPTYLMSRVAETLAREGKSYDFIDDLTGKIIGVGTHTKLDQCVGYNVEVFYYGNVLDRQFIAYAFEKSVYLGGN